MKKAFTLMELILCVAIMFTLFLVIIKSIETHNMSNIDTELFTTYFKSNLNIEFINILNTSFNILCIVLVLGFTFKLLQIGSKALFYKSIDGKKNKKSINLKKEDAIKCEFCNKETNKYRTITFSFTEKKEYFCCEQCFKIGVDNNMKITSLQILKDFILKEKIIYANDYRLRNFYYSKIKIDNNWTKILNEDFFTNYHILLPLSRDKEWINTNSNTTYSQDDSNFWLSYIIADMTDNPIPGYVAGKSFMGAMLGSNGHLNNSEQLISPMVIEPEKISQELKDYSDNLKIETPSFINSSDTKEDTNYSSKNNYISSDNSNLGSSWSSNESNFGGDSNCGGSCGVGD